jgi:hypothetical protein
VNQSRVLFFSFCRNLNLFDNHQTGPKTADSGIEAGDGIWSFGFDSPSWDFGANSHEIAVLNGEIIVASNSRVEDSESPQILSWHRFS